MQDNQMNMGGQYHGFDAHIGGAGNYKVQGGHNPSNYQFQKNKIQKATEYDDDEGEGININFNSDPGRAKLQTEDHEEISHEHTHSESEDENDVVGELGISNQKAKTQGMNKSQNPKKGNPSNQSASDNYTIPESSQKGSGTGFPTNKNGPEQKKGDQLAAPSLPEDDD